MEAVNIEQEHLYAAAFNNVDVLLIEDNYSDALLVEHHARNCRDQFGVNCRITNVPLLNRAIDLLERRWPDVILLDLGLPDSDRLEGLRAIVAEAPSVPVVILTGHEGPQLAYEALAIGAQDYLRKDGLDSESMFRSITYAIQRKQVEDALRRQAYVDRLTGLCSRVMFEERFSDVLLHAERTGDTCAICVIDLDGFKTVNDTLGHDVGDKLLSMVGRRLKDCTRETDLVARLGGDEFVVVATHLNSVQDAEVVCGSIAHSLSNRYAIDLLRSSVTASVGVSLFPMHDTSPNALLKLADAAMYRAKREGGRRFVVYDRYVDSPTPVLVVDN